MNFLKSSRKLFMLVGVSLLTYGFTSAPALADKGLSLSVESLFAPLGKQVEQYPESARRAGGQATNNTTATEVDLTLPRVRVPGRETAEWLGVSGFFDLNKNWRLLYGAHTTLLNQPLFKLDGGIAFMVEPLDKIPVQTYFFVGATPVLSPDPAIPNFSITSQAGLGVNYTWNNILYSDVRLNFYVASLVSEETEQALDFNWNLGAFSLAFSTGILF